MPPKEKIRQPDTRPSTYENLQASTKTLSQRAAQVAEAEARFELEQTPAAYSLIQSSKAEYSYQSLIHDIAARAHSDFERAEAARVAQVLERERLAKLAIVDSEIQANEAAACSAVVALCDCVGKMWSLATDRQACGETNFSTLNAVVNEAARDRLVELGLNPGAIRLT